MKKFKCTIFRRFLKNAVAKTVKQKFDRPCRHSQNDASITHKNGFDGFYFNIASMDKNPFEMIYSFSK